MCLDILVYLFGESSFHLSRVLLKRSLAVMRNLSLISLVFLACGLLGFCEYGKSENVFVSQEMLREYQDRVFDRMDRMDKEMREIKERLAEKTDKVLQLFDIEIFTVQHVLFGIRFYSMMGGNLELTYCVLGQLSWNKIFIQW